MNALGDSKSEKLILIIVGLIVVLGIGAMAIETLTDKSVGNVLTAIYGALSINGIGGLIRNTIVDGPIRQQQANLNVSVQAKDAGVEPPQMIRTLPTTKVG